jgi:hypothetical protein
VALALRANVAIRAPQSHRFELICTPERLPEWNISVERGRRAVPGEQICLGARAIFNGRLLGQTLESETEVVEFEPPRLFATRAIRGPRLTTRFELHSFGDDTHVYVDVSGDVPGGAIGTRLAEGFLRRELTTSLQRLRAVSETQHT